MLKINKNRSNWYKNKLSSKVKKTNLKIPCKLTKASKLLIDKPKIYKKKRIKIKNKLINKFKINQSPMNKIK